ncbi:CHAT domain-containing protein [Myxococcus sp. RHSTA-1-4]|uniref:CHAT domain-containing protein n=1 Tax=Myxococcus sp. RHSTA-1-4 TaxID=2874601 RepID=UPI001CBDCE5A|nr:CHAT domain-containing protein [Myxococcus sp. RHSTA-1-4]MBZ4417445.1 CHAT domain-containing protein [Myxococcus sp. RHSTA-1-4]
MTMEKRLWLQIDIDRVGDQLRASGRGSDGENPAPHILPNTTVEDVEAFGEQIRQAAKHGKELQEELLQAQRLYKALLHADLRDVMQRQHGYRQEEALLLRLGLKHERSLQAIPWEALCQPDTNQGFLGNSDEVLVARSVVSNRRAVCREVSGAVRVLGVSLVGRATVTRLQAALDEPIRNGEVEFDFLVGAQARRSALIKRLARPPSPHILHLVCHGRVDERGRPQLEMLDDTGTPDWFDVELLAQDLHEHCREYLRLIVLDACEGAQPGGLVSAAECLAQKAAGAVVAYLWPVKSDITQHCSEEFYKSLTRESARRGDVAVSLNAARRAVLTRFRSSAEAFSPVLFLRGDDSVLFDFQHREVQRPPPPSPKPQSPEPSPALRMLLKKPFTLVLGDRWSNERDMLKGFRRRLIEDLASKVGPIPDGVSMSALTQHYALRFEEQNLDNQFQDVFGKVAASLPLVEDLARRLAPGVHVTLLRFPILERALDKHRPDITIHVINPPPPGRDGGLATLRQRKAGARDWEIVTTPPRSFNPERDIILLRLYCGYLPPNAYMRALLTEDDYLFGVSELDSMLTGEAGSMFPPDLVDELVASLTHRPALVLGMSMLTWHHRRLLYQLFGRSPLPKGSLVVLEPGEGEQELWRRGRILPPKGADPVLELSASQLAVPLSNAEPHVEGP